MPAWQWWVRFLWLAAGVIGVLALALSVVENHSASLPQTNDACHEDVCAYAVRSMPLHPATIGEQLDAQRAVDYACRDYRACTKRQDAAADAAESGDSVNSNLNPTVREFWRKEAEREAKLKPNGSAD